MSKTKNEALIRATDLLKLQDDRNLVLVDTRSGQNASSEYKKEHLKRALHVDLDKELSNIKEDAADGGRHPLPTVQEFAKVLTSLGITKNSHVVVYDDKNGAIASARFWWMLKASGHKRVQVLNGGLHEALKVGYPLNSGEETVKTVPSYEITDWQLPTTNIKEVEVASKKNDYLIIDVRAQERYNGITEPIDLIAGHIPGAVNVPFSTNMDEDGLFLNPEELKQKYQGLLHKIPEQNVIVHCGSGVTACHTLLAMAHAGMEIPNLYVGSWSEWSQNNKPIGTNLENLESKRAVSCRYAIT